MYMHSLALDNTVSEKRDKSQHEGLDIKQGPSVRVHVRLVFSVYTAKTSWVMSEVRARDRADVCT